MIARYHGETESADETVKYLESITKAVSDAVNARDFEGPIWVFVASSLVSKLPWLNSLYGLQGTQDKSLFVDAVRRFTTDNPESEWYARTLTTHINRKENYAETFVLAENVGCPPGLVRQGMCRLEYRRYNNRWLLARYEILSGTAPGLE